MATELTLDAALEHAPKVVFDTSVLIDAHRRVPNAERMIQQTPRDSRSTSVVALWEFLRDKERRLPHATREGRLKWLDDIGIRALGFSKRSNFRSLLPTEECPAGLADAILAAECLARRFPLVTRDMADFMRVPGLLVVLVR